MTPDEVTLAHIWNNLSQAQKKFLYVAYQSLNNQDEITEERTLLFSTAISAPLSPYIDTHRLKKLWLMRPAGKALVEFAIRMGATPKNAIFLRLKRAERGANVGLAVLLEGAPEIAAYVEAGWEIIDASQYRNAFHTLNDYYYNIRLPPTAAETASDG